MVTTECIIHIATSKLISMTEHPQGTGAKAVTDGPGYVGGMRAIIGSIYGVSVACMEAKGGAREIQGW